MAICPVISCCNIVLPCQWFRLAKNLGFYGDSVQNMSADSIQRQQSWQSQHDNEGTCEDWVEAAS